MDLKDKKCVACHSYVPPLALDEKERLMKELNGAWGFRESNTRIRRDFKFKNFKRALEFANAIGAIAEAEKHHPEIFLGWGHCDVEIWTHTNSDLVENDFILAAKIDQEYSRLYPEGSA